MSLESKSDLKVLAQGCEPVPSMEANPKDNETFIEAGKGRFDLAAGFLQQHKEEHGEYSQADADRVRRKVDFTVLPMLTITVILNSVDKILISNATLYGLTKDTGLVGQQYSWVISIFYFGYLVAEFPSNYLIQKLPIGKLLGAACMSWSAMLMISAACNNAGGLMTLRFFMGMCEAPTFPLAATMTVMWYRSDEQALRTSVWIGQWSSIFAGIISYGIGHTSTAIAPWRLLFLVVGGASFLWGVFIFFFLPDSPVSCKFLSNRQKYIAIHRIQENKTGIENKTTKWYQVREAFTDWKTWPLAAYAFLIQICSGGLTNFSAQIVSSFGFTALQTTLIGMPAGVIASFASILVSIPASRIRNAKSIICAVILVIPLACALLIMKLPTENRNGRLAAYYSFYCYWGGYPTMMSIYMANTSGHSKKITRNAIMFVAYCVGNIVGPQFFRTAESPSYPTGFRAILSAVCLAALFLVIFGVGVYFENRKRRSAFERQGTAAEIAQDDGNLDLTDKEKKTFVYAY